MTGFAVKSGLEPFQVQQSSSDQKHDVDGNRTFYWSKDLNLECSFAAPKDSNLICLTDVDYYVDMPEFLAWNSKPTLLYTFVPSSLAKSTGEYSYTFHANNEVEQNISGGATYRHRLWNYGSDHCRATWRLCGLPIITTTYLIERRNIDEDHQLVFFSPTARFYGPFAYLVGLLSGTEIERLAVADGEYTRMKVQEKTKLYMCTGKAGGYVHAKIPVEQDDAIALLANLMKNDITPPTVQSYTGSGLEKRPASVIVCAYHRDHADFKAPTVYPVEYAVKNYTYKPEVFIEHAKPMLKAFMSPIVDACYSPTDSVENEEVGIAERVTNILSDVEMPVEYVEYVKEFLELLIPEAGRANPMDLDTVYERQNRPTQRHLIDEGVWTGPDMDGLRKVNAFMKAEAYTEPKPPRNISTINSRDKVDYSCFIYAAAEHLKQKAPWYAFGKHPKDIAERVAYVCQTARRHGVNSDLSRFDGRLSEAFRFLEAGFLARLFSADYHSEIDALHKTQFNLRGRGRHGTAYDTKFSRLSGSPETALFNSLANAFIVFVSLRESAFNAKAAWSKLGIYGGDDGLTADLDVKIYTRVAEALGMKTTCEKVERGDIGIKFLARLYSPDVWNGSPNSCCDMLRQLSKFHATANFPAHISPAAKLIEKARGFYLSDRNTPVIGQLATKVMELTVSAQGDGQYTTAVAVEGGRSTSIQFGTLGEIAAQSVIERDQADSIRNYASLAPVGLQYPNTDALWMRDVLEKQIPTFDFNRFNSALSEVVNLEQILAFPCCAIPPPPTVTIPLVLDDAILAPEPVPVSAPVESPPAAVESKPDKPPPEPKAKPKPPQSSKDAKPDAHASHKWRNRAECHECHPELLGEWIRKRNESEPHKDSNHKPKPPRPAGGDIKPVSPSDTTRKRSYKEAVVGTVARVDERESGKPDNESTILPEPSRSAGAEPNGDKTTRRRKSKGQPSKRSDEQRAERAHGKKEQ